MTQKRFFLALTPTERECEVLDMHQRTSMRLCLLVPWIALPFVSSQDIIPSWIPLNSGVSGSLRGVVTFNDEIAWACGQDGTILRTTNSGDTWDKLPTPPGAESVDFRDIEVGPDGSTVMVLGVGNPALIFYYNGNAWERVFFKNQSGTFYDAMGFWNHDPNLNQSLPSGIAFGDPINGQIQLLKTSNFGDQWEEMLVDLDVGNGVGGFAASGTCLRTVSPNSVFIGLGIEKALILASHDRGQTWSISETEIQHGGETTGVFSLAFRDDQNGIAVGGNFLGDNFTSESNSAITSDGGLTWTILDSAHNP
eukprot:maker-scaffold128_size327099-snap-gene-2.17 protein:Tk06469 transcript:maker-scaffold128_size327099-snap-gene-2.17-mRNA-1 annotation:"oxidoreductase"